MDAYKTIANSSEGQYKDRGSKFLSFAYPLSRIDDVEAYLSHTRALHPKSRHICYAYILGIDQPEFRINDDGEPSGSAGRPIFNAIRSASLTNTLIAVVRYFGGTKLGIPGLIAAYKNASINAIENNFIITRYLTQDISIIYTPQALGRLYDIIKRLGISDINNFYEPYPHLVISQRLSKVQQTILDIYAQYHGYKSSEIDLDFSSPDFKIQVLTP